MYNNLSETKDMFQDIWMFELGSPDLKKIKAILRRKGPGVAQFDGDWKEVKKVRKTINAPSPQQRDVPSPK